MDTKGVTRELASPDPEDVLDALSDDDSRRILAACGDSPHTVNELAEECEVPLSSVYRKVETLVENGLLEERVRPRKRGRHPSEYGRATDGVSLRFTDDGVELALD